MAYDSRYICRIFLPGKSKGRGGERERGVGGPHLCHGKKLLLEKENMGALQECRKRCRMSVYKIDLAQQIAGVLHSDSPPVPFPTRLLEPAYLHSHPLPACP